MPLGAIEVVIEVAMTGLRTTGTRTMNRNGRSTTPAERWAAFQPPELPEADRLAAAVANLERMTPEQSVPDQRSSRSAQSGRNVERSLPRRKITLRARHRPKHADNASRLAYSELDVVLAHQR